jgi:hypothetical protein
MSSATQSVKASCARRRRAPPASSLRAVGTPAARSADFFIFCVLLRPLRPLRIRFVPIWQLKARVGCETLTIRTNRTPCGLQLPTERAVPLSHAADVASTAACVDLAEAFLPAAVLVGVGLLLVDAIEVRHGDIECLRNSLHRCAAKPDEAPALIQVE